MNDALSDLSQQHRGVIVEILTERDPALLSALRSQSVPTREQRLRVLDIVGNEFCRHLRPDDEPTEHGVLIDDALGKFLLLWPIERQGD